MRIISISNHKGGTGKTTTTLNLGKALALQGKKVLVIDLDPQANLSQSLGIENPEHSIYQTLVEKQPLPLVSISERFDLVPSELNLTTAEIDLQGGIVGISRLKNALRKVSYDFVLIDCPPSLGILTLSALLASTHILIPVEAHFLSTKGLVTIMERVEELQEGMNPHLELLGLVMTKTENTKLSQDTTEVIADVFKQKLFKTTIRKNVSLAEAPAKGTDIFSYAPKSYGAIDYAHLAEEILAYYGKTV